MDERAAAHRRHEPVTPAAGLAHENERLQLMLQARLDEQEALRRVALLVAQQHAPEDLFALVAEEVARHLDADAAMVARYDGPGAATVIADWSAPGLVPFPVGQAIELGEDTSLARVQATGAPARVDSYAELEGAHSEQLRALGMEAGVAAPIVVDGLLWGAVAAGTAGTPVPPGAESRLGAFAELLAQSIANAEARILLNRSRVRIVQAADDARRGLERDLHDGAQQRLVGLALSLRLVANRLDPERKAAARRVHRRAAGGAARPARAGPRDPPRRPHRPRAAPRAARARLALLAARGRRRRSAATGCPRRRRRRCTSSPPRRSRTSTSTPRAGSAEVRVEHGDGWVEIAIADDGVGGAPAGGGSGLRGLTDRVDALGGRITVDSGPAPAPPCAPACPSGRPDAAAGLTRPRRDGSGRLRRPRALRQLDGRGRAGRPAPGRARRSRPARGPAARGRHPQVQAVAVGPPAERGGRVGEAAGAERHRQQRVRVVVVEMARGERRGAARPGRARRRGSPRRSAESIRP